ncbi:MAG: hypothetical protein ACRYGH_07935 [Janthinobacterium lividum]
MKALVLVGLLAFGLRAHGQVHPPDERAALVKAVLARDRRMAAAGDRVARAAPYVFIGRPLTGEDRPDRTGRWYQSTVLEVVEVLRGAPGLVPGTVVVTDTAAPSPARPPGQRPTDPELWGERGQYEPGAWGVYFCRPSALPGPANRYRTDNPRRLRWYAADARVQTSTGWALGTDGCRQETRLTGLGQRFASETDLWTYLEHVAHLRPRHPAAAAYPPPVLLPEAAARRGHDYRTQPRKRPTGPQPTK